MPGRFTIVAMLSALLLVVTVYLWQDGNVHYVTYGMKGGTSIGAGSEPGHASFWVWRATRRGLHAFSVSRNNWTDPGQWADQRHGKVSYGGFRWYRIPAVEARNLDVPFWFLSALIAVSPLVWLARFVRRQRRTREGCCRRCGYDLTGNASGVCLECGQPTAELSP